MNDILRIGGNHAHRLPARPAPRHKAFDIRHKRRPRCVRHRVYRCIETNLAEAGKIDELIVAAQDHGQRARFGRQSSLRAAGHDFHALNEAESTDFGKLVFTIMCTYGKSAKMKCHG